MTNKLTDFTDEQLAQELERRAAEKEQLAKVPEPLEDIDWGTVRELCVNRIQSIATPEHHEDNDAHYYIYEAAINAVFGSDIWEWVNKHLA